MLEVRELRRRFGSTVALDGLTFDVPSGTVFGFLGPNGAGKTTAMRTVMGISRPDSGEVRWNGEVLDPRRRQRFGYLPEERGLYPTMVVGEQLVYLGRLHGMSARDAETSAERWLERLGIADRSRDKLETLSLGNQQRVQLAAALVHAPELLVLDEPFSGLDPVGIDALGEVLREEAAAGITVLFSSHQLDLVEHLCECVAIVDRGRLVAGGAVADLTAPDGRHLIIDITPSRAAASDGIPAWAARIPKVRATRLEGNRVRLVLGRGVDPDDVLRAARRTGRLQHFSYQRPKLSEVFLNAVRQGRP